MGRIFVVILAISAVLSCSLVYAHPGNTDSYGCHTCRTNCPKWGLSYGEYHCHNSKSLPQPEIPIKSHQEGYSEPAPEYNSTGYDNKVSQETNNKKDSSSSWGWLLGLGFVGFMYYIFKKGK
jgi:hypothetical protein